MASATLAQARAYLGIDGNDFNDLLRMFLDQAEIYVRGLTGLGDDATYPDALVLAQLVITQYYWNRREGPLAGAGPPSLTGYLGDYELTGLDRDVFVRDADFRNHAANENAHHTPPEGSGPADMTARVAVDEAMFATIDTDFVELVPAPGAGKFLAIQQIWLERNGDDLPTQNYPRMYYVAISPDATLSQTEAEAGNSETFTFVSIPTWPDGETRYVFVGLPVSYGDLVAMNVPTTEEPEDYFARVFERAANVETDGVPVKWWRTKVAYADHEALIGAPNVGYYTGWTQMAGPNIGTIEVRTFLASLFLNTTEATPAYAGEYEWVAGSTLAAVLNVGDGLVLAENVGGHGLFEDKPLMLGIVIPGGRANVAGTWYEASAFDNYIAPVQDTTLDLYVRYQVHDIFDFG